MRLIDADAVEKQAYDDVHYHAELEDWEFDVVTHYLDHAPTVDAVPVSCKIGDLVYGIRHYNGKRTVQKGFVSEMFFTKDMKLMIVVKHVCRGFWLDKVFPTYDTAAAAELESRWQQ